MRIDTLVEDGGNSHLPGSDKHRITEEACWEKIAKLTPFSNSDAPSGKGCPGDTLNDGLASDIWEVSS